MSCTTALASPFRVMTMEVPDNTGGPFARSRKQEVTSRAIRVANYWTARPNLINTASFVYNRYRNPSLSTQADGGWNQYLGLQDSTSAGLFPQIQFGSAVNGVGETLLHRGRPIAFRAAHVVDQPGQVFAFALERTEQQSRAEVLRS